MPDLIKEYVRFPTLEHFERCVYAVAYSTRVPSHIKFKHSNILIWRDYRINALRIGLGQPIYPSIVRELLLANEAMHFFRPTGYHVLRYDEAHRADRLFTVERRIVSIEFGEQNPLKRCCQLLKDYLYYTAFTRSMEATAQPSRKENVRVIDGLESIQGYY